jgi:hypothetical protein
MKVELLLNYLGSEFGSEKPSWGLWPGNWGDWGPWHKKGGSLNSKNNKNIKNFVIRKEKEEYLLYNKRTKKVFILDNEAKAELSKLTSKDLEKHSLLKELLV